jgi:PAS domain S-box-containing protein
MNSAAPVRAGIGDEQTLLASIKNKFSDFVETVPDAMILSDQDGRILLANSNAERMFGYSRDELVGQEVEILIPERFRTRHRQYRTEYYADPSTRPMGVGRDLRARGKDGIEFPVEISLSLTKLGLHTLAWSAIRNVDARDRSIAVVREAIQNKLIAVNGLTSICAWCKRIRDEGGFWQQLEGYIESHSKTRFTHGICEDCLRKLDPADFT